MTGRVVDPIPTLPTLCQCNILDGARAYHSPQPLAGPNPRPKSQMHSTMRYTLPRLKHEMEGVSACFSCPCPGTCVFSWRTHHKRELFLSTSCITVLMIPPNTRVVTRRTPLSLALRLQYTTSVSLLTSAPHHPQPRPSPCIALLALCLRPILASTSIPTPLACCTNPRSLCSVTTPLRHVPCVRTPAP